MYRYIYIFGTMLSMRSLMINVGSVVGLLTVTFLLARKYWEKRNWKDRILLIVVPVIVELIIIMIIGSFLGSMIRNLTYPLTGNLKEDVLRLVYGGGNHFIGTMIVSFLILPVLYRKLYKNEASTVLNIMAFYFVIQHFFSRIGCFFEGCCYGIPMHGGLAVKFPDNVLTYKVFPSQLFEAFCMLVLFAVLVILYRKGKDIFYVCMAGFGTVIIISEIFMDKSGTVTYLNLSVIQMAAILLLIGTGICLFYKRRMQR